MGKILVSACLTGEKCKYSGGDNYSENVVKYLEDKEYISVCPEVMGGLPCPRPCCERVGDKVINTLGEDVTVYFKRGASIALKLALDSGASLAILKSGSPSCGEGKIYDGSFTGVKIPGNGILAEALMKAGIKVINETGLTLCPVCKKTSFSEKYEICPECGWENDGETTEGGANKPSLEQYIKEYEKKIDSDPSYRWDKNS